MTGQEIEAVADKLAGLLGELGGTGAQALDFLAQQFQQACIAEAVVTFIVCVVICGALAVVCRWALRRYTEPRDGGRYGGEDGWIAIAVASGIGSVVAGCIGLGLTASAVVHAAAPHWFVIKSLLR